MSLLRQQQQQQKQLQAAQGSTWLALASSGFFWLFLALSGLGFTFFYCYINQNRKSDFATIQQFRLRCLRVAKHLFILCLPNGASFSRCNEKGCAKREKLYCQRKGEDGRGDHNKCELCANNLRHFGAGKLPNQLNGLSSFTLLLCSA